MEINNLQPRLNLKSSSFWLLAITAGLTTLYFTIVWQTDNSDLFGMSTLFIAAIYCLISKKSHEIKLTFELPSIILGTLIIAFVLYKSTFPMGKFPDIDKFIYVIPLISGVGLSLIASGFRGLRQYWQELLLLFFLGIPSAIVPSLVDISLLTAKFSNAVLWYSGFEVQRQGVHIILPTGSVEVYSGCSGMVAILYLWALSALYLVMFPTKLSQKVFVPIVATLLAFMVNGVRVALMAILAASSNKAAFDYWHTGNGSQIFAVTSVLIFGLFCLFLLKLNEVKEDSVEL